MSKVFNILDADNFFIGEDKTIVIDVVQSDGTTAQAMTGWGLVWELKASAVSASALISKTPSIGNGSATDDRATITVADTDSEAINPGTYYHHLRRNDAGLEAILSHGTVVVKESGLG